MSTFFFDTADCDEIKRVWETKLQKHFEGQFLVEGITTNPNAMAKMNIHTMDDFKKQVKKLAALTAELVGGHQGVVYVQAPNSNMTLAENQKFLKAAQEAAGSKVTVGLKIPPRLDLLENLHEFDTEINVTGLADCSTALGCLSFPVEFISLIPGRMEERGINAREHVAFVQDRKNCSGHVIAGSMRTLEQLQWTIEEGCYPTVGIKVLDLLDSDEKVQQFRSWLEAGRLPVVSPSLLSPLVQADNIALSREFFKQMDEMGSALATDFLK